MMRTAMAGQPLIVNNPTNRFQLLFLDDALDCLFLSLTISLRGSYQCINLASYTFPSMREMARRIVEYCKSESPLKIGSTQLEDNQVMNLGAMRTFLGHSPRGVESSLRQMTEWLEKG